MSRRGGSSSRVSTGRPRHSGKRFDEAEEGTRGLHNPTLALADAKQQLEELKLDATPAQRRSLEKAAALLPKLDRSPDAQDKFVELVLSVLSRSKLDKTEGLPQIRKQSGFGAPRPARSPGR